MTNGDDLLAFHGRFTGDNIGAFRYAISLVEEVIMDEDYDTVVPNGFIIAFGEQSKDDFESDDEDTCIDVKEVE